MTPDTFVWMVERYDKARKEGHVTSDEMRRIILTSREFVISSGIADLAQKLAGREVDRNGGGFTHFPDGAVPPADSACLTFPNGWRFLCGRTSGREFELVWPRTDSMMTWPRLLFLPGASVDELRWTGNADYEHLGIGFATAFFVAAITLTLINAAGPVEMTDALAPRAERRRFAREAPTAPELRWTEVRWAVGAAQKGGNRVLEESAHPRALHWVRGHWMRVPERTLGARLIDHEWRVWRRDHWRGHPDYGVNLSTHMAHLPGEAAP